MEQVSRIRKKVKKNDKWGSVRCKRKPNQGRITPQSPHGAVRMSENTGMGIAVIRGNHCYCTVMETDLAAALRAWGPNSR